jgi:hypothetical protein
MKRNKSRKKKMPDGPRRKQTSKKPELLNLCCPILR